MPIVTFTKAQRRGAHMLIAMVGESDCGKTYSAILLARGLVGESGKVALLDTENGRGRMYSNISDYDYAELTAPFTPERYIESISAAEEAGYEALIIDSGSHEWDDIGGVLEIADSGRTKAGEPLQGLIKWAQPKARHKRFVKKLLSTRMHIIICLRAKEKREQKGKEIISKGYVSVQEERFVYDMTLQLFLPNHGTRGVPIIERPLGKCPGDLTYAFPPGEQISIETGKRIAQWVACGAPIDHAYETLKCEAEEAADGGEQVLDSFLRRLTKTQQAQLVPIGHNLRSKARAADRDNGHTLFGAAAENGDPPPPQAA